VPVSSVPPPAPAVPARGSAASRSESPLPQPSDAAPAGVVGQSEPRSDLRSSRRKGGQGQDAGGGAATTSNSSAAAKPSDSEAPAARAGSAVAAGAGGASFGQTLNATLFATAIPARANLPSGSAELRGAGATSGAGVASDASASASRGNAPNSTTADPARISDTISAARAAAPEVPADAASSAEDTSPAPALETVASSPGSGSSHAADGPPAGNLEGAAPPPVAALPTLTLSAPATAADAATADSSVGTVDVATRAVPTSAQLFAELTGSLGDSNAAGIASPAKSADDAPGATQAQAAATAAAAGSAVQPGESSVASGAVDTQPLHSQVGTAAWSNELGARLTLMAQQGITSASLRLSPPQLGPLEVRIAVRDNSAAVWFGASQSDTRAALEQALPRLRELFASHGLNLTNAGVSGETPRGTATAGASTPVGK